VKIKSIGLRSDYKLSRLIKSLNSIIDIIVTTPDTLVKLRNLQYLYFSEINHIVFDESDTLFSKGFNEKVINDIVTPLQVIF
jgi:superfamily II DNA/RNA helicase